MTEDYLLTQDCIVKIFTDKIKVTVKPQNSVFTGDTVTLSCDMEGAARQRTVWFKDSTRLKVGDETEILRNVNISNGGKYACTVSTTTQSQKVVLTVRGKCCFYRTI